MAHTKLKWIQNVNDGVRFDTWFDTGITYPSAFTIDCKFQANDDAIASSASGLRYGAYETISEEDATNTFYALYNKANKTLWYNICAKWHNFNLTSIISQIYREKVKYTNSNVVHEWYDADDTLLKTQTSTTGASTFLPTIPIYIYNFNQDGTATGSSCTGKFYYWKLYDADDNLISHIYGVLDDNGVVCLYDEVTSTYIYRGDTTGKDFAYEVDPEPVYPAREYYWADVAPIHYETGERIDQAIRINKECVIGGQGGTFKVRLSEAIPLAYNYDDHNIIVSAGEFNTEQTDYGWAVVLETSSDVTHLRLRNGNVYRDIVDVEDIIAVREIAISWGNTNSITVTCLDSNGKSLGTADMEIATEDYGYIYLFGSSADTYHSYFFLSNVLGTIDSNYFEYIGAHCDDGNDYLWWENDSGELQDLKQLVGGWTCDSFIPPVTDSPVHRDLTFKKLEEIFLYGSSSEPNRDAALKNMESLCNEGIHRTGDWEPIEKLWVYVITRGEEGTVIPNRIGEYQRIWDMLYILSGGTVTSIAPNRDLTLKLIEDEIEKMLP